MKTLHPYLVFNGNCRAAMEFYRSVLGGELEVMGFADAGMPVAPDAADRVIHAHLQKGDFRLMASDNQVGMSHTVGDNVSLMLECESDEEVEKIHRSLCEGGRDLMAPHDAFWGARFAMVTDAFGVNWMLAHNKVPAGV